MTFWSEITGFEFDSYQNSRQCGPPALCTQYERLPTSKGLRPYMRLSV